MNKDRLADLLEKEKRFTITKKDGGEGGFGVVLFVEDSNKKKFAIKAQNVANFNNEIDQQRLSECKREAQVMRECDHKNIIELRDEFMLENYHFIQMDLCSQSLEGWIEKNNQQAKKISQLTFMNYSQQIIDGIEYLHNQNYIVRDLSVRNILINEAGVVKLCDFGLAKKVKNVYSTLNQSAIGAKGVSAYFPPEVLMDMGCSEIQQTKEADIWALGICLKLFGGISFIKICVYLNNILEGQSMANLPAPNLDTKCNKLIDYILINNPKKRPTIHDIRSRMHKVFIEGDDDDAADEEYDNFDAKDKKANPTVHHEQYSMASNGQNSTGYGKPLNAGNNKSSNVVYSGNTNSMQNFSVSSKSTAYSINSADSKQFSQAGIARLVDFNYLEADNILSRYKKLLKDNPKDINCLLTLGFLEALYNSDFTAATQYFQQVRELDDKELDAILGLSLVFIQQGQTRKYKLVEEYLDDCNTADDKYWRVHYFRAWLYFLQQKYNESNDALQKALLLKQDSPQLISLQAVLLALGGRQQESIEQIKKAESLNKKLNDPQIFFRKGYIYHKVLKNDGQAIAAYKEALNNCEKDMMTLYNLTQLYYEQNNSILAESMASKSLSFYPKSSHMNYLAASIQPSKDQALRFYLKAVEVDASDVDSLNQIAKIYYEKGQFQKATEYYAEILALDNDNIDILTQLGLLEMEKTKNYDKALYYYKRALALNPNIINTEICIGLIHGLKNDNVAAAAQFEKIIQKDPKNHRALCDLGITYMKLKQYDNAIQHFLTAYNINKDEPISSYQLGFAYKEKKLYPQAINYFKNVIRLNPNDPTPHLNLGICEYEISKESESALSSCKRALSINPNLPDAYRICGDVLFKTSKYKDAVFYLLKTIEFFKTGLGETYYQLGYIENENNKYDSAIFYLKKCIEFDFNHFEGNFNLGLAYRDKDLWDLAWAQFQKTLAFKPNHVGSLFNCGYVCQTGYKKYLDAITYYKKAIEFNPRYPSPHYNLARIYDTQYQDVRQAYTHYQKVLEINPNFEKKTCETYIAANKYRVDQMNRAELPFCQRCTIF